ncbi:hypothetical protein ACU8KH_03038 [Lachancea thermotolerans]
MYNNRGAKIAFLSLTKHALRPNIVATTQFLQCCFNGTAGNPKAAINEGAQPWHPYVVDVLTYFLPHLSYDAHTTTH